MAHSRQESQVGHRLSSVSPPRAGPRLHPISSESHASWAPRWLAFSTAIASTPAHRSPLQFSAALFSVLGNLPSFFASSVKHLRGEWFCFVQFFSMFSCGSVFRLEIAVPPAVNSVHASVDKIHTCAHLFRGTPPRSTRAHMAPTCARHCLGPAHRGGKG